MKHCRMRHYRALSIILCMVIAAEMPLIVRGATLTNELIEESESNKKEAEQSLNSLKSGLTDVKKLLSSLNDAKSNLAEYIEQLDTNLSDITARIDELDAMLVTKEAQIAVTEQELLEAKNKEETQYEAMKKRIRFMYEKGNDSYVELLLTSESFADFLNKAEFIEKISKYDREMLTSYEENKERIAEVEARLISERAELEEVKDALNQEQEALETLIASKEQEISAYESDIATKEQAVREYEAEIAEQDALIKELEAAIIAEKKRLLSENKKAISYDGGEFAWPAPEYTRISDEYGMRMHPTLGVEKFHNGIDLASPTGSPILAAYDGEVAATGYSGSMGNYIMIDHGDELYTIYMHASSISCEQGQLVVRGEQIGKVGSTGRSTGPHLHFGVRKNGEYVDPLLYIQ